MQYICICAYFIQAERTSLLFNVGFLDDNFSYVGNIRINCQVSTGQKKSHNKSCNLNSKTYLKQITDWH